MLFTHKILFGLSAICMFSAQALAVDGTCSGTFDFDNTDVVVTLDGEWRAMTAALELDDTSGCKDKKDVADGFLCTTSGNLVTSLIDDDTASSGQFVSGVLNPWLASATATGPDTWAVVHMDIFMPGICEDLKVATCNLDGDDGTTPLEDCYISKSGDEFATAEEACEDSYSFSGEGMFAAGETLTNRHEKKGSNKNWAMAVRLAVTADCSTADDTDQTNCEAINNDVTVELIADGGDYGEVGATAPDDYLEVGTATFEPTGECIWTSESSCFDAIQNGGEEGVDCGAVCENQCPSG